MEWINWNRYYYYLFQFIDAKGGHTIYVFAPKTTKSNHCVMAVCTGLAECFTIARISKFCPKIMRIFFPFEII